MGLVIRIVLAVLAFIIVKMVLVLVIPSETIVFLIALVVALLIVFGDQLSGRLHF